MKLYIMRHAKAEKTAFDGKEITESVNFPASLSEIERQDFARRLSEKGKNEIKSMLERLKNRALKPTLILSSPATRAAQTARGLAKGLKCDKSSLVFDERLYTFDENELLAFIKADFGGHLGLLRGESDANDYFKDVEIFLVGHNPALRELCELLSVIYLPSFPTCSVFALEFDEPNQLKEQGGKFLFFEHIKNLKNEK